MSLLLSTTVVTKPPTSVPIPVTNTHVPANKPVTVCYRTISIDQAVALPLTTIDGNLVKVVINYNIEDESLVGQRINAVMGIYGRNNGSLIRLSSFKMALSLKIQKEQHS